MRKCTGNNTHEWGSDAIFDVSCKHCGEAVEFFKDEIVRNCHACGETVTNDRKDYGLNNGVRRTQSTQEASARSSNDQRVGFTGDCEGERRSKLIGG